MDNAQLEQRIAVLEAKLRAIGDSNSMPIDVDRSMRARFKFPSVTGLGTSNTQNLSVGGPGSYTIPAQPTGTLKVTVEGVDYQLLYQ